MKQDLILPHELIQHLKKYKNDTIVDKEILCKNNRDKLRFFATLSEDYGWDYSSLFNDTTIYFEVADDSIYGGVYIISEHAKLTRKKIATSAKNSSIGAYIYKTHEMEYLIQSIF